MDRRRGAPDVDSAVLTHEESRVVAVFEALAAGDAEPAIHLLDDRVEWRATAARDVEDAKSFDLDGARRYLTVMASAIAHRGYRLDVLRVERASDGLTVTTAWRGPGGVVTGECANHVRLEKGLVVSVIEQA
jgi:hypothetical protein